MITCYFLCQKNTKINQLTLTKAAPEYWSCGQTARFIWKISHEAAGCTFRTSVLSFIKRSQNFNSLDYRQDVKKPIDDVYELEQSLEIEKSTTNFKK